MLLVLLLSFAQVSFAESWYTLTCRAELFGSRGVHLTPEEVSEPFELRRDFFDGSRCAVQLSPLTVLAIMINGQPPGSDEFEPTLWVQVHKGNPVTQSISRVAIQGSAIFRMAVGDELNVMGAHHHTLTFETRNFSGFNYRCGLRRVR